MTYRYLSLLPELTFAVSWRGGQILVVARTCSEVRAFIRCEYDLSLDVLINIWKPTPEHAYECEQHGMETVIAIP